MSATAGAVQPVIASQSSALGLSASSWLLVRSSVE
jgi:hypothetical protein